MSNIQKYEQQTRTTSIFNSESAFEYAQRMAKMLSQSDLVPAQYRDGQKGIANTLIALELANRIGASPFQVMQNLDIIEGRPAFRAKFVAASLVANGYALKYETENLGKKKIEVVTWVGPKGARERKTITREIENIRCRVVATYQGNELPGTWVTMEMANQEGWVDKPGSKWLTMPEQMIKYRAVSFFASIHAPDLLMGMRTREELEDMPQLPDMETSYYELEDPIIPEVIIPETVTVEPEPSESRQSTKIEAGSVALALEQDLI